MRDITGLAADSNGFSITAFDSFMEPFLLDPPIISAAAGEAAATAATVVIAAADAAVAIDKHFESMVGFGGTAEPRKQHEPVVVDGGVGGETGTIGLTSEIVNRF